MATLTREDAEKVRDIIMEDPALKQAYEVALAKQKAWQEAKAQNPGGRYALATPRGTPIPPTVKDVLERQIGIRKLHDSEELVYPSGSHIVLDVLVRALSQGKEQPGMSR